MPRYLFRFEAIHADWPAYPAGAGTEYALETMCSFPEGTHFQVIDEIDRCLLLVAREYLSSKHAGDLFSKEHHHVALDQHDLVVMHHEGWLHGLLSAAERREHFLRWSEEMPDPVREDATIFAASYDWETLTPEGVWELNKLGVADEGVSVSPAGWQHLYQTTSPPKLDVRLAGRVEALVTTGLYDSAVREASVILESSLRQRLNAGPEMYGRRLLRRYAEHASSKAGLHGAFQRHLRSELRTVFMFVRNEFAHSIVELDVGRCYALLRRISTIFEMLDIADAGVGSFQDIVLPPRGG